MHQETKNSCDLLYCNICLICFPRGSDSKESACNIDISLLEDFLRIFCMLMCSVNLREGLPLWHFPNLFTYPTLFFDRHISTSQSLMFLLSQASFSNAWACAPSTVFSKLNTFQPSSWLGFQIFLHLVTLLQFAKVPPKVCGSQHTK